jgi:hypothetical protein
MSIVASIHTFVEQLEKKNMICKRDSSMHRQLKRQIQNIGPNEIRGSHPEGALHKNWTRPPSLRVRIEFKNIWIYIWAHTILVH